MKSVVLLSSGLDSSANLYGALKKGREVVLALTFDYGQRAAPREIDRARRMAESLGVPHRTLSLPFFSDFGGSSLVDRAKAVPTGGQVAIDDHARSLETAKSVWVPNRNGILLNVAAGFAEALKADTVIPGFNREEASTFPDNSLEFLAALEKAFAYSTANKVRLECFTADADKPEVARRAQEWGVDFALVWPCYLAGEKACGTCESCQRDKRAYRSIGLKLSDHFEDPA